MLVRGILKSTIVTTAVDGEPSPIAEDGARSTARKVSSGSSSVSLTTGTAKLGGTSTNEIDVWDFADEREGDDGMAGLKEPTSNVYGNGHALLYADVADAIESDRAPYVDARAGRDALEVVLAIYKSQRTGLPVELPLGGFASTDMEGEF